MSSAMHAPIAYHPFPPASRARRDHRAVQAEDPSTKRQGEPRRARVWPYGTPLTEIGRRGQPIATTPGAIASKPRSHAIDTT